jgi:hypothetical protein
VALPAIAALQARKIAVASGSSQSCVERAGVGIRLGRELVARTRACGEEIRDPERCGDIGRLRDLEAVDELDEHCHPRLVLRGQRRAYVAAASLSDPPA